MTDHLTESTSIRVPDKLYFGSSKRLRVLNPDSLFLTPLKGIASIFSIDRKELVKKYSREKLGHEPRGFMMKYAEWSKPDDELMSPLKKVHMYHNYKGLKDEVFTGKSKGYIYEIDPKEVSDNLELFVTKDSSREVVYKGTKPIKPTSVEPVEVEWELSYRDH